MASIGLKYPIYAPLTETETTASYSGGKVIAKAIKANLSIELVEAILYADDGAAESSKEFKKGTLALNVNDLPDLVKVDFYGHRLEPAGIPDDTETQMLVSGGADEGKDVGVGFYARKVVNGVKKYRAIWLTKVKFGVPDEEFETNGENINYKTPTTNGTIMIDVNGDWKKDVTVATEAKAKAWLNALAGIS